MDSINDFFLQYGYWGMAVASFLAGTFVPFNSEAVMAALIVTTDMNPWMTVLAGTAGNVAGTMVNYFIGRIGSMEQICKWLHVKEKRVVQTRNYVEKRGSWIAIFSFLPIFGSAIAIALGILRANWIGVMAYSLLGKMGRYIMVAYSAMMLK